MLFVGVHGREWKVVCIEVCEGEGEGGYLTEQCGVGK